MSNSINFADCIATDNHYPLLPSTIAKIYRDGLTRIISFTFFISSSIAIGFIRKEIASKELELNDKIC
jgi:hypothetical protein